MSIIINLQVRKRKTSTRHHSFASELNQIDIYLLHLPIPLELTMVLEFLKSQRGKPKLKHEGYLYCMLREKDGLKTWRCDKIQSKAIATTFEDNVFLSREHLHEPDVKHSEQLKVLEEMKEKAANSNVQPRKIVQDTTATTTREFAVACIHATETQKKNCISELSVS